MQMHLLLLYFGPAYLQGAHAFARPPEGHLKVLQLQRFLEIERDRAKLVSGDDALLARPPRLLVFDNVVPGKLGRTTLSHAAGVAAGHAEAGVVAVGVRGDGGDRSGFDVEVEAGGAGVFAGPPLLATAGVVRRGGAGARAAVSSVVS